MEDKIRVISLSTAERNEETERLYEECKKYVKEGYTLAAAVQKIKNLKHRSFVRTRWYQELKHRAREDGYQGR